MHELSLCGAIADITARRAGDRTVDVIHIRLGQLRQVVPDTLVFCWSLVSADTDLDGSVLAIERVAAQLQCRQCGGEHQLGESFTIACADCSSCDVDVVAGDEFLVTALELRKG